MVFHFLGEELTICYADPLLPANIRWGRKFYWATGKEKKYNFLNRQNPREYQFFFRQEIFRHKHFTCKCPRCEVCEITLIACELESMSCLSNSSCQKMGNFFGCTLKATFAQEQKLETSSCDSFEGHKIRQWLWLSRQCADVMVIFTEMVERWNLDYSFQNWSWPGRGKAGFLFN